MVRDIKINFELLGLLTDSSQNPVEGSSAESQQNPLVPCSHQPKAVLPCASASRGHAGCGVLTPPWSVPSLVLIHAFGRAHHIVTFFPNPYLESTHRMAFLSFYVLGFNQMFTYYRLLKGTV